MANIVLREEQDLFIEKIREKIREGHKSIVCQAPTGFGKTVIFSFMSAGVIKKGGKVLILTDRVELLGETSNTLTNCGVAHVTVKAGAKDPAIGACVVAMSRTLANRQASWGKWWKEFTLVVFDEVHKQEFNEHLEMKQELFSKDIIILGFTATPRRTGNQRSLAEDFTALVRGASVKRLVELGRLVPCRYFGEDADTSNFRVVNGEYKDEDQFNYFDKPSLYGGVVENYLAYAEGKTNLVFCVNIHHSIKTCLAFREKGIDARFLVSELSPPKLIKDNDPGALSRYEKRLDIYNIYKDNFELYSGDREELLSSWMRKDFPVLVNAGILTTGFNFPELECVQVFRATLSENLWVQMIGRGSRVAPGKSFFIILDHGGNFNRHGGYMDDRDYSLIHEKYRKGGEAPIKECGVLKVKHKNTDPLTGRTPDKDGRTGCGAYITTGLDVCPFCGYKYEFQKETTAGLLSEASHRDLNISGLDSKSLAIFQNLDAIAKSKGYNPYWVPRQILISQGEAGVFSYARYKGYGRGWAYGFLSRISKSVR